jgi:hypothetical protein
VKTYVAGAEGHLATAQHDAAVLVVEVALVDLYGLPVDSGRSVATWKTQLDVGLGRRVVAAFVEAKSETFCLALDDDIDYRLVSFECCVALAVVEDEASASDFTCFECMDLDGER